jgi:hypothetical protein
VTYDGSVASLSVGGQTSTVDVNPNGPWNALSFFLRADSTRFDTSSITVSLATVNGQNISFMGTEAPLTFAVTDSQGGPSTVGLGITLDGFSTIQSVGGTFAFNFVPKAGATGSPNSALQFSTKAYNVTEPGPAPIPLPAAGWLLLTALGGLAFAGWRRNRAA